MEQAQPQDVSVIGRHVSSINEQNKKFMSLLDSQLTEELKIISGTQLEECKVFSKEILVDAEKLKRDHDAFIEKLKSNHDESSAKSVMKSKLKSYLQCFPGIQIEKFKQLLEEDLKICETMSSQSQEQVERVKADFQKFILKQQQLLIDFSNKQQAQLYGRSGPSLMDEWEIETPGQPGEDIQNWAKYCSKIEGASFIRFSIACGAEAYFALGDTEEAKPKRIVWYFAGYGNRINAPHWMEKDDYDNEFGDPHGQYAYTEPNSLYGVDMPRWFEVNWNVEGKDGMIELSSIKNEEGEGKKVWSTFPKKDCLLNYFMVVTGYNQRGIWKLHSYR